MAIEVTSEFLEQLNEYIAQNKDAAIKKLFDEVHYADIAEILDEVSFDDAIYIIKLLNSEKTSEILTELDEDIREKILENLSAQEIADEIGEMDTDDAADIIGELSDERQERVINALDDEELAADIKELLSYQDNTAGALMAKELVKVYETWTVAGCMRRIRGQAKDVTRVHSIYVVDKEDKLAIYFPSIIINWNWGFPSIIYISCYIYISNFFITPISVNNYWPFISICY